MRLIQFLDDSGERHVGLVSEGGTAAQVLDQYSSVYTLALAADRVGSDLASLISADPRKYSVSYDQLIAQKQLLPPLDHPDPAHCFVTGTGLTHLGSARARDNMHSENTISSSAPITDSMRMFQWGLESGKPSQGEISVQPEWFYKGNGNCVVAPEHPLPMPSFALDAGEEPELVGLYIIGDAGRVLRVGFALGNEFSDHVMEQQNYLYLAHSKLRPCSFGPELLVGNLPQDIQGQVRIWRNGHLL